MELFWRRSFVTADDAEQCRLLRAAFVIVLVLELRAPIRLLC